jgi:hypothetical protein
MSHPPRLCFKRVDPEHRKTPLAQRLLYSNLSLEEPGKDQYLLTCEFLKQFETIRDFQAGVRLNCKSMQAVDRHGIMRKLFWWYLWWE